jgi:hypothetical protein
MMAGHSELIAHTAIRVAAIDPCADDLDAIGEELYAQIPAWNLLAKIAYPNLMGSLERSSRLGLDLELTALIIETRARLGEPGSPGELQWPTGVCPSRQWRVQTNATGASRLFLNPPVDWPQRSGIALASEFHLQMATPEEATIE